MTSLPRISIVIPTLNSARTLKECLESIVAQEYPKECLEVIIVDGGSSDSTPEIAKNFGANLIKEPSLRDNPEARKAIGLSISRYELVAFIDSDNILPHQNWLKFMVEPLLTNREIIATQPLRYQYKRSFSLLNRYFALFGVNDPIAYYFNKRDRLSWAEDTWRMMGEATDMGSFYLVKFSKDRVPTLGANGFLARRDILLEAKISPAEFFHIDINHDLVSSGYNKYGIIKDTIIHLTADNLLTFFKKRLRFMKLYHQKDYSLRRWKLYETRDKSKLIIFIIYALTLVRPFCDSIRGFLKIPDIAWFLHPFICLGILVVYGVATVEGLVLKVNLRKL